MTSIFTWLHCFGTLVSVLAHKYPSKVPEFMAYQSITIRCYSDYEDDGWLAYLQAFRRKAAYENSLDGQSLITLSTSSAWKAMPEGVWYAGLA